MTVRTSALIPGVFLCLLAAATASGQTARSGWHAEEGVQSIPAVLSMRDRAAVIDLNLDQRLTEVLPALMRREGIDMWIVAAREYNEDPVIRTMLPATWLAARRRTILVLFDPGPGTEIELLAVARYPVGSRFQASWDPESEPDQWAALSGVIAERSPRKIGLNTSTVFALGDGLTRSEHDALVDALSPEFRDRLVSADQLAVGWLEARTSSEMEVYPQIVRIARSIIREGFSDAVITPGVTTTDDLVWWYRDRIRAMGLATWFHPSVGIQRAQAAGRGDEPVGATIRRGDLLHVDFGITYLRLNTDTQQHAYVLRPGERDAPNGLRQALAVGNRLQDLLTNEFATGRSGNRVLESALAAAADEGIRATIYTHPIGFHGHGAGPTIGLWDQQGGVEGRGDYPLYPNTAYSIELNALVEVPEWGGHAVRIMLEEDAFFDGAGVRYIDGRQQHMYLVR
jgi:Xaa-Pro aminopeptidase